MTRTAEDIDQIFSRFQAGNQSPKTELNYHNTFTLLVAVVLSAQMTDKGVNKATESLFKQISKPEDVIDMGIEDLEIALKSINLYRNKSKYVMTLCHQLLEKHEGEVPSTRKELEALAGVGRKTANVVLNVAFGEPTMAVDTHIFRVSHRLKLSDGKTPLAVEQDLLKIIPDKFMEHAHHWLVLHGRYVCKARRPECEKCFIEDLCPSSSLPV